MAQVYKTSRMQVGDYLYRLYNRKYDSIWVIIDRITRLAHFLSVTTTHLTQDYTILYIQVVVRLHGVTVPMISDRGA